MNNVIGVGKTIDQAIEDALEQLHVTQDQVTIKVINEGGLFKKAKVEVSLDIEEDKSPKTSVDDVEKNKKVASEQKAIELDKPIKPINSKGKKEATKALNEKQTNSKSLPNKKQENIITKSAIVTVDDQTAEKTLKKLILDLLKFSKSENITLNFTFEEKLIFININGEKLGGLIGASGETMNALENYINVASIKLGINKRIRFDIGGYKEDRAKKLEGMAEKAYQIAIKSGKYKFEPMPARDRRIIHATLQNYNNVTTYSKGTEPKRFVIVEKK